MGVLLAAVGSLPQQEVDHPAAHDVLTGSTEVIQDRRLGTAGVLEAVRQEREVVPAALLADGPGQPRDAAIAPPQPGWIDTHMKEVPEPEPDKPARNLIPDVDDGAPFAHPASIDVGAARAADILDR